MELEALRKDMVAAMKAKDKVTKDAVSSLISAVKKVAIDEGCRDDISGELVDRVILKELKSVKEQIDTSTPAGKLLFTLMSAVAQFERDVIAERTKEGLDAARARGHIGGRPRTNAQKVKQAVKLYHTKQYTVRKIEELTGVKKATLYRSLRSL